MTVDLPDQASTEALGAALARAVSRGARPDAAATAPLIIGLRGALGAGKTTFARGLIRGLGHRGRVPSPTYTLVEPYMLEPVTVYHIDLYRVSAPEELEFLGLEDCETPQAVWLVEWPERAGAVLAHRDVDVCLARSESGRRAVIEAHTVRGRALLASSRFRAGRAS